MTPRPGLAQRVESYRPSKTALGWSCALSVAATMVVGFTWGGWVTGGTAAELANKAAQGASANLAAAVCTAQFNHDPDMAVHLVALNKLDTWQRGDFLQKGGWATLPGVRDSVMGSAELCARELTATKTVAE